MNPATEAVARRDRIIAALLRHGSLLASVVIGVGVALGLLQPLLKPHLSGLDAFVVVGAGIALLILLPAARVGLMLILFLHERDYLYAAISALVLTTIAAGIVVGW